MAMQTNTKVAAVSKIKMATALLFLGAAALAASAAGGLAGRGGDGFNKRGMKTSPDLVVRKMTYTKTELNSKGSSQDRLKVYYMNTGSGAVNQPFYIMIRLDPAPYTEGGVKVQYISPTGPAASGFSGAIPDFIFKDADIESPNHYVIPVENVGGDSLSLPQINKYNLAPGEWGHVDVYLPKYFQDMLENGMLSIDAFVDYAPADNNGKIPESNEKNNQGNIIVKASSLSTLQKNFCEMDYNPTYIYPPCVAAGQQYACVDKYTGQFKGCSPDVKACAEYVGEVLACDTAELTVIGQGTFTAEVDEDFNTEFNFPILAGTDKNILGRIKVTAEDDDIMIDDFAISVSSSMYWGADPEDTLKAFSLYSGEALTGDQLLDNSYYSDGIVEFSNINFSVEKDSVKYLYVTTDLNSYQFGAKPHMKINIRPSLEGMNIKSSNSGDQVTGEYLNIDESTYSQPANVVVVPRPTVYSTFPGGSLVGGNQTIFSFEVNNHPNPNVSPITGQELKIQMQNFSFGIDTDVPGISDLELCRLDNGECIDYNIKYNQWGNSWSITNSNGYLDTYPDSFSVLNGQGSDTEFVLKATVSSTTDKFLQAQMHSVNGGGFNAKVLDTGSDYISIYGSAPNGTADWPTIYGGVLN